MSEWTAVEEEMPKPGNGVLAHYLNSHGNSRRVRAMWLDQMTADAMFADGDWSDWDDEHPPMAGWYETADNAEECWRIAEPVTHWMDLPEPPVTP